MVVDGSSFLMHRTDLTACLNIFQLGRQSDRMLVLVQPFPIFAGWLTLVLSQQQDMGPDGGYFFERHVLF